MTVGGIDLAAQLDFPTRAGELSLHAIVTNLLDHDVQVFEGSVTTDRLGRANFGFALPEWRGVSTLSWTRNAWSASYALQWIGPYADCTPTLEGDPYCGRVPSVFCHDVDASYRWGGVVVRAGVSNLTDRDPPYLNSEGNTNVAT